MAYNHSLPIMICNFVNQNVTGSGKTDLKAHNTKIELLVPADFPMFGEYSNGQSASIAHSVAKI